MTPRSRHRVVVVGDVVLDRDVVGHSDRLCPDAPVPVVDVDQVQDSPGGAGLTALLCRAADTDVTLVAPVADDEEGLRLRELLDCSGVRLVALDHAGPTRSKTRVRSAGQSLLRIDRGGPGTPVAPLGAPVREALDEADVVLVSDYGAGTTSHRELRQLLAGVARPRTVCWDPHPRGAAPVAGCTLVTPNLAESRAWADHPALSADELASLLRERWQARGVCVTTGPQGAWLATSAPEPFFAPVPRVSGGDPCGAGDRFAASVALALARGAVLSEAVVAAVQEAAVWVEGDGAAGFRGRESETGDRSAAEAPPHGASDCRAAEEEVVQRVRSRGGVLVATGGCFDVLHAGHVSSLEAARALGDGLVVLLNSDASVRRLKGPGRPVQPAADRARVLLGLASVDAVVVFDEDDPGEALERLRPDVWAKGGDYDGAALPEAQRVRGWGGRIVLLPYLPGRSTTAILEEIR